MRMAESLKFLVVMRLFFWCGGFGEMVLGYYHRLSTNKHEQAEQAQVREQIRDSQIQSSIERGEACLQCFET